MRWLPWLLVAVVTGCGNGTSEDRSCTPLASEPAQEIFLSTVLGIGRHADGTLYLLDQRGPGDYRAFVSQGASLGRRSISGIGTGQEAAGTWYVVTIEDPDAPFTLKVDDTSGALRMGVVRGVFADRDFVIGEMGDVLEVQSTDAITGMTVLDVPGGAVVEYFAHLPDGRALVVTRPSADWSYGDFRLFVGTAERMIQQPVASVQRARDGGTTWIQFTLDGTTAIAFFPSPLLEGGYPTLDVGGDSLTLALEPAGTSPTNFSFLCL